MKTLTAQPSAGLKRPYQQLMLLFSGKALLVGFETVFLTMYAEKKTTMIRTTSLLGSFLCMLCS